jgi:hypothetical protein
MQAAAKGGITTAVDTKGGFSGILAQSPPAVLLVPRLKAIFLWSWNLLIDCTCRHERADPSLNAAG